ncbi:MAG: hypothetical protein ACERKD_04525 [Prolixibacteraceae bacterium]
MKTKIIICWLSILLSGSTLGFAQERKDSFDFDKFKADKIAFITEAINLTPAEAEKFWPVYNEYEKKKWDIMRERHEMERNLQDNLQEMSDKEYTDLSVKIASFPKLDGELNLKYNEKFLKILSPQKVVKLYIAETKFRGTLLRKYRNNNHDKNNNN